MNPFSRISCWSTQVLANCYGNINHNSKEKITPSFVVHLAPSFLLPCQNSIVSRIRDVLVISGSGWRALNCSWILIGLESCAAGKKKGPALKCFLSMNFSSLKVLSHLQVLLNLLVNQGTNSSENTFFLLCAVGHLPFQSQTSTLTKANYPFPSFEICQEHKKWCARPAHRSSHLTVLSPGVMDSGIYNKKSENKQALIVPQILSQKFVTQGLPELQQTLLHLSHEEENKEKTH